MRLAEATPHKPAVVQGINGRAPKVLKIQFTSQELFGAMARCSHLHTINPAAVTFESEGCRYMISQHVDDQDDNFFILPSVRKLKDFSRTHLIGVVGAGIAYLQMIRDGYVWCDHFENLTLPVSPSTKRTPDFVFSRPGQNDVAITESKATHGSSRKKFRSRVKSGYLKQVDPYLGLNLSGAIASHGFSIGSWMTSLTKAELMIAYTEESAGPTSSAPDSSPSAIKRGNYLTVLSLMFGPDIAFSVRNGNWPLSEMNFITVRWLDREWLLGNLSPYTFAQYGFAPNFEPSAELFWTAWLHSNVFALESNVARAVFQSFASPTDIGDPLADVSKMDDGLVERATASGGAVYPDGLAVLGKDKELESTRITRWNSNTNTFVECAPKEEISIIDPFQMTQSADEIVASVRLEANEETDVQPLRITMRPQND